VLTEGQLLLIFSPTNKITTNQVLEENSRSSSNKTIHAINPPTLPQYSLVFHCAQRMQIDHRKNKSF